MTHKSLLNELWQTTLSRLGGTAAIDASAREMRAFLRPRVVFRHRSAAADPGLLPWRHGASIHKRLGGVAGLADLSNVALLQRLRKCGAWMEHLVGQLLSGAALPAAGGRRIRLLDGTTVPKAGKEARENNGLWRLHCGFDLPSERFSFIGLTDEKGGERLDRTPFDRAISLSPIAASSIPILWRTSWSRVPMSLCAPAGQGRGGSNRTANPSIILAALAVAGNAGVLDRPVWIARKKRPTLALRLVAIRKPPVAVRRARRKPDRPQSGKAKPSLAAH